MLQSVRQRDENGLPVHCGRGVDLDSLLGMIQRDDSNRRLYVLLHNIDGPGACCVPLRSCHCRACQTSASSLLPRPELLLVTCFDRTFALRLAMTSRR